MKNPIKKIALLLAVLTCSSTLAAAVSADSIFVSTPEKNKAEKTEVTESAKESEEETDDRKKAVGAVAEGSFIFSSGAEIHTKNILKKPSHSSVIKKESVKNPVYCDIISGGKYYTTDDAKDELKKYFSDNSSEVFMLKGESKAFCSGAYFYSDDTDVVVYNSLTGKLEAVGYGTASVYVYTSGGIPFYRIDVTVGKAYPSENTVSLSVVPDKDYIKVGETVYLTVTASDGKTYDDITYSLVSGTSRAVLSVQKPGKLTALKNGTVVVRAESKSNPEIYGECLIYIGSYKYAVSAGYWTNCDDGIRVDKWFGDVCGDSIGKPSGWIKCTEGYFIPVLKLEEANVVQSDGSVKESTVLTTGSAYIPGYKKYAYKDIDLKNYSLSLIIKDIIG